MATKKKSTTKKTATGSSRKPAAKKRPTAKTAAPKRPAKQPTAANQLRRTYKNQEIVVDIVDGQYIYEGETYKSISGLARHIVGYSISGPVFFKLTGAKAPEGVVMGEPSIAAQVVALTQLSVAELRVRWREIFGEPTTQRHKQYLVKRIAWELQRRHFGEELSPEAKARLHELQEEFRTTPPTSWFKGAKHNRGAAPSPTTRKRPVCNTRSPKPGTVLTRDYKDRRVVVHVRGDREFEWNGEVYRSLSAVAKAVTGSHCSGVAFFGLSNRKEVEP